MAWYKDAWCVLSVIKFNDVFTPCVVLSIYPTKTDALDLISGQVIDERWPTKTHLIKYDRNIGELKEGDILHGHRIDVIFNFYERDCNSDAVREVI